jgi:16S rRNA (guanine(966)-N(2))-methyltransferase RsmD
MRIVAGTARGRPLQAPRGSSTRPTSDKIRGAVFNILGQFFPGGAVLDLYAGTGAMALEALSRGCDRAVCVDRDHHACEAIRRNVEACGLTGRVDVRSEAVESALARLPRGAFSLVFVDPPYAVGPDLALDRAGPLLAAGGRMIAEHDARHPPADRFGPLALVDRRAYGTTGISIYVLE